MIRDCTPRDAERVAEIYNYYVEHTIVTFETDPVTPEAMGNRIKKTTSSHPWLVYEEAGRVVGYAYAAFWNPRCAYRHASESSIYLDADRIGRGIGGQLYTELLERLLDHSTHCVIGGVALPNEASIALHERLGFEKVAHFKQVGWKFDKWIDVGYWELVVE